MNIPEYLEQLRQWVEAKEPFYHVRYNDGESLAMYRQGKRKGCPRHVYTPEISAALKFTLDRIVRSSRPNILLGSNCDRFKYIDRGLLATFLGKYPHLCLVVPGDSWYTTEEEVTNEPLTDKGLIGLIDTVRQNGKVVLVTNSLLQDAKYCLGATWVEVPPVDGWQEHDRVLSDCFLQGGKDSIYIWCAGFPGKVLSWQVWDKRPQTSHIDLGSLFDCVFHVGIANWMLRKGKEPHQLHRQYVEKVIEPYVKSFIPKER